MANIGDIEDDKNSSSTKLILTFGYGNRTTYKEFFEYLERFQVTYVIDIRISPRAWSRNWYKEQLEKACTARNVVYISKTSLGNTSGKSHWIPPDSENAALALSEVSKIAEAGTILLLCAELCSSKCHRTDVARELQKLIDVEVKHLD